ncbi:translocation/assembly module TamB domain-containing protein [Lacinutrix sp. MEBiC02404]
MEPKKVHKKSSFWKIVKRTILVLFVLFVALILFIRSPWGQDIIVTKATNYVSNKTNTKVEINKLYLTFSGNLLLKGLYLEDIKGDTLVYSKNMEASVALLPLIKGDEFYLKALEWEGLKANVYRKDSISSFNYQFLLDAFTTEDTTTVSTSGKPIKITLGKLHLKDIDVTYKDAHLGMQSDIRLNSLNVETNAIDLEQMGFDVNKIELTDGVINYKQTKPFITNTEEPETKSPLIAIQNLDFNNTRISYNATPDQLDLNVFLDALHLQMPVLDLEEQVVMITDFQLRNSVIGFQQLKPITETTIEKSTNFEWPQWKITANNIDLSNNQITAKTGKTTLVNHVFNSEDIQLKDFNFKANTLLYQPENASVSLEKVSFIERSGFQLKKLTTQLALNTTSTTLKEFSLHTNNNSVAGTISIQYNTINTLINAPDLSKIAVSIPNLSINPKDAFFFAPELKNNSYLTTLSRKQITGALHLNGTLNNLNIPKTALHWGKNTKISAEGFIKNILDTNTLYVDLKNLDIASVKKDALAFTTPEIANIEFPATFRLKGSIHGGLSTITTNAKLITSDGNIAVKGNFKNTNTIAFNGNFDVTNLQLGKILKNEKLGVYAFTTAIKGEGTSWNTLNAELTTNFKQLSYNNYDFSQLNLNGKITNGNGNLNVDFKDENLDFEIENTIQLDSVASKIHSVLQLKGVNFQSFGLTQNDVRAKFNLEADIVGNDTENLQFKGLITDALSVRDNTPYLLGDISFDGALTNETTAFTMESNPVNADLFSNTDIANLITELQNQFNNYFEDTITPLETDVPSTTTMQFNATVKQAPILKDLFLPKLESLAPIAITIDFNAQKNLFKASANAPQITYDGSTMDSLDFSLNAEKETLNFDFALGNLKTGAIAIQKINVTGNLKEQVLYSNFNALDSNETLIQIASEVTKNKDSIGFHINPKGFLLNKENWSILPNNKITYAPNFLGFTDFKLSQNDQQITVSNTLAGKDIEHIGFDFKNFELSTITSLFNQEKLLASGELNGEVIIENPFGDLGIIANTNVSNLQVIEVPLGALTLNAKSITSSKYDLNLAVNGANLNLDIVGDYEANKDGAPLHFDIDLKNLELKAIEQFAGTYISKTSGNLSGKIKLTGTSKVPKFLGNVKFNASGLTINALNASFLLPKESIKLDNTGIYFDAFTLEDTNKNPLVLDGKITTKNLINPSFDLTLKAKNIEVLNSTEKDNDLFYGKVNLDTDVAITGTLELPKVRGSLMINEASNFTYVIPEDEVNLVEKEGIVIFVNKENPEDILTKQTEDLSSTAVLTGYDIDAQLTVSKKAIFNIIVDERSGDNLKVSGTGDFKFGIAKNGDMSLSGKYEVDSGHYEVSLYNLVKRHFDIAKGSSIVWRGNPLEADMDIRAIYEIETAASGLMATQLTGESASVTSKYRQQLPFLVYLNLKGQLLKPEISFNLDIPKDSQGELGGAVYAQVQQINTQEDELNKQVFSLLVLNQFFPSSTSDGSSGGSLSIARDNANSVLSNQLNNFSNKLLGKSGIELDFGIDSYTDYQGDAPTNKTQLDVNAKKRLFNDRLIVEVGSGVDIQENSQNAGETTPLVGTVNIQYLFDDNGRWRLKAYRKNDFQNVIDGQIILTGISLIFNQEFNKFEELFAKTVKEEVAKIKEEEKQSVKQEEEKDKNEEEKSEE